MRMEGLLRTNDMDNDMDSAIVWNDFGYYMAYFTFEFPGQKSGAQFLKTTYIFI